MTAGIPAHFAGARLTILPAVTNHAMDFFFPLSVIQPGEDRPVEFNPQPTLGFELTIDLPLDAVGMMPT
jgi:hypothetical protein